MTGNAPDDSSVSQVLVAIKNKNTNKWWDAGSRTWSPVFQQNAATLQNPGGATTGWSHAFDVPASGGVFFAQAEAVDSQGQHDPTVAIVNTFTVESQGDPTGDHHHVARVQAGLPLPERGSAALPDHGERNRQPTPVAPTPAS